MVSSNVNALIYSVSKGWLHPPKSFRVFHVQWIKISEFVVYSFIQKKKKKRKKNKDDSPRSRFAIEIK